MKIYINDNEFISISQQSGKMQGILSISTNKRLNENCKRMSESKESNCVCKYCYVDKTFKQYKDLEPVLTNNTNILTSRLLNKEEIDKLACALKNQVIIRFESFGDLINEIQLLNYIAIAKACKYSKFALFTKHYTIISNYFEKGFKLPSNITLVLSSPFINYELQENIVNKFKKYHKRVITFTVVNEKGNANINCGKRKCIDCRNCYDVAKPKNVIELLKH